MGTTIGIANKSTQEEGKNASHGVCPPVRLGCPYNRKTNTCQADNLTDTTSKLLGGS